MGSSSVSIGRRVVAVSLAMGLVLVAMMGATGAGAHPGEAHPGQDRHPAEEDGGIGVQVNEPQQLEGFRPAVQWDGTAKVDDQRADLVYAGTGCSSVNYAGVEVEGEIALVDSFQGQDPGDECPTYTFFQKMAAAEQAGAIGLVQVSDAEAEPGNANASGIPGLEISNEDGRPLREAVRGGDTVNVTLVNEGAELVPTERLSNEPCVDGQAGPFECDGIDLLSFVPMEEFDGAGQSDLWGWTDPDSGDEYVMMGKTNGVAFFRINEPDGDTDPTNPVYLGELPNPALVQEVWHDLKVHDNHAFIVSESEPHGMTVFDLTRLRGVDGPQEWDRDAFYPLHSAAHNIEVNTETDYAYILGGNAGLVVPDHCLSGLHIVDISTPTQPTFAGCYAQDGGPGTLARTVGEPAPEVSPVAYVHDAQCVLYKGPDPDYQGDEICMNSSETHVGIANVTDKLNPQTIATVDYPHVGYTHQGWLTEDHEYLIVNDELDESDHEEIENTRTLVFDVTDLDDPKLHFEHFHDTKAITHNNYVDGGLVYQSNYSSGLRVLDTAFVGDPDDPRLDPLAFFDTYPPHSNTTFDGTWSNYPFFDSGTIAVSGRQEGLFLLRLQDDSDEDEQDEEDEEESGPPFGPPDQRPPDDRPAEGANGDED